MSARLWIPCVLVAACQTASPLPLCEGDPAGAVGWSVGGGMLEQSDMVLAPEGHEVWSLDENCTFLAYDRASESGGVWSAWRTGTLTADEAEDLRARLDLDQWAGFTHDGIDGGAGIPDKGTMTFRAGDTSAGCVDCTAAAEALGDTAREVLGELLAKGADVTPSTVKVAVYAWGEGFIDDPRALHVDWASDTAWTDWEFGGPDQTGVVAPEADVPWLLDVWAQQVAEGEPGFLVSVPLEGETERGGLAIRPLP